MCHNCHSSTTFRKFLKEQDPALYQDYTLESFQPNTSNTIVDAKDFVSTPQFKTIYNIPSADALFNAGACRIKTFPPEFYARQYLENRKVPLTDLWYTDDFAEFVSVIFPAHDKTLYKEPRIIIPFYDKDGNLIGVQGRAIGPSKIKYITVKTNEDVPKIFGWNKVDTSKRIYVVEGPIDSLFLVNAIATMDAALYKAAPMVGLDFDYTFVYDNEPRNKQVVSNMIKTIAAGRKCCIWPDTIQQKDINEMVLAGNSPAVIQHIIDNNTYEGLMATMKLNQWSRL